MGLSHQRKSHKLVALFLISRVAVGHGERRLSRQKQPIVNSTLARPSVIGELPVRVKGQHFTAVFSTGGYPTLRSREFIILATDGSRPQAANPAFGRI